MSKTNYPTVTIGISAHDEQANIGYLLESILSQNEKNFKLEKVIVVCDGCTDGTADAAKKYLGSFNGKLIVIDDGKRVGKMKRLAEIYKMNKSDVVVIFDADVILKGIGVLSAMIKKYDNPEVVLVGGNSRPVAAQTFVGKMINGWSRVWYETRLNYRNGDNLHNSRGCALALEKNFAKSVHFPSEILSDSQYLYLLAIKAKKVFHLARDAIVLYRKPENLGDYVSQTKRSTSEDEKIADNLGNWVFGEYKIPTTFKVRALVKCLSSDPMYTTLGAILNYLLPVISSKIKPRNQAAWQMAASTKKAIVSEI